ncbi:MAG: CBS domain-containing protein [Desulfobaccales bacterium]
MPENLTDLPKGIDLKDEDIFEAMKSIPGYLDITPGDFKEVYRRAYAHALERLSRAVTAQEIMTREVVSVRPDTPLAAVAEAMGSRGISGVPVLDDAGRVVGVISEKDFLTHLGVAEPQNFLTLVASCLQSKGCVALPIKQRLAADLMTSPAVTVSPEASVQDIAALFTGRGINRVPVTDPSGRLLGLVSRGDLVRAALGGGTP